MVSDPQSRFSPQTTIVTGFFDLAKLGQKTKHEPGFYLSTAKEGILSIKNPMIIFTDSPTEVIGYRMKYPTEVVNISLSDFEITRKHLKRISDLLSKDFEGISQGYSGLLFTIYHCKAEMMAKASHLNPFKTEKFLWMDMGAIRNWGGISAKDYVHTFFPRPDREYLLGRDNKVLFQGVAGFSGPCSNNVRWVNAENPNIVKDPTNKVSDPLNVKPTPLNWWIAGSIFGGTGKSLQEYEKIYALHLQRYLEANFETYSLIDQYLMGALACHSTLIEVVNPPLSCCVDRVNRKWFFLLLFLKDESYPQKPYSEEELKSRPKSLHSCKYC